ncbi:dapper homolog 3-like [Scophthalmus maximus]|uniref:dapper homolog 3-like n=1 Tax=Scophthalmus maximus TaxID=52904 RepID=UPI001FA93568|nr:dapper homolog 3-like [Scophthalmus maximus]
MHRAFSFPVTVERSRTKERLEASLAGLCELELRKQRQECLVLGALALGEPLARGSCRGELACFSSWGQENLTLRRQLSALQSSPWGLMQALEQQVGELRVDADDGGCYDGAQADAGDSRPSSGFYESSEGQSPKGRSCSTEPAETVSSWVHTSDRPKSVGDPVMSNGEADVPVLHAALPRSFSAPYPPLEGIAEEGPALDAWQGDPGGDDHAWRRQQQQQEQEQQEPAEDEVTEEDYQQALRVENYILALLHRHTLSSRPCQPRTTLSPDPPYCSASAHGSLHRRTPSLTSEQRPSDPPNGPGWACDRLEGEACGGEAPSFEEDCYLALPYPQSRPHSLAGRLPSPLPSLDPNCGAGALDLCCEPASPQHYLHPQPPFHHKHNLVSAQYIPGQGCHAPVRSPRHYNPEQAKPNRPAAASPDRHPNAKSRPSKKTHAERQRGKKSGGKTNRSQSENSLLGQRVLPERRYSTTERHGARGDVAQNQGPVAGPQGGQRWCSNLELSQDEGEVRAGQAQRRPPRKARHGQPCSQPQNHHHHHHHHHQQHKQQQPPPPPPHTERWHPDPQERAPLCQGEGGYAAGAAPAESESSMSEVYSPASSSLSSDSDESGGLVWPQQLPPRLASTSSSSSPSPQASANAPSQPKAFVKIKASHALKKKILRFRSGSLKVMTTV